MRSRFFGARIFQNVEDAVVVYLTSFHQMHRNEYDNFYELHPPFDGEPVMEWSARVGKCFQSLVDNLGIMDGIPQRRKC